MNITRPNEIIFKNLNQNTLVEMRLRNPAEEMVAKDHFLDILRQPDSIRMLSSLNRPANPKIRTHRDVERTLRPAQWRNYLQVTYLFIFALFSCCKDESPNPCINIPPVSAEFNAVGFLDGYGLNITCNANGQAVNVTNERRWTTMPYIYQNFTSIFAPVQKFDSVKWKVGSDPRIFKSDTLSLVFPDTGRVLVTLVGYRKPDLKCNPLDDGVDTVQKVFKIYNNKDKFLQRVPGRYEGAEECEPNRKRVIEIQTFLDQWGDVSGIWIKNFPLTDDPQSENVGPPGVSFYSCHDLIYFPLGDVGGLNLFAWMKFEEDGRVVIDYSQKKPPYSNECDRIIKRFIGKRI